MSNPNPVKQQRDSARGLLGITTPFAPRQREPGEATQRVINTFATGRNRYKPAPVICSRASGEQHKQYFSKGM